MPCLHAISVATISRLFEMIGLFCRISPLFQGSFAKETYNFKEPTNHSHPICHAFMPFQLSARPCNTRTPAHTHTDAHADADTDIEAEM